DRSSGVFACFKAASHAAKSTRYPSLCCLLTEGFQVRLLAEEPIIFSDLASTLIAFCASDVLSHPVGVSSFHPRERAHVPQHPTCVLRRRQHYRQHNPTFLR